MASKITALKLQKRNPQRVNVYLDGEFAFGLSRIVAAWLHIDQELSDEKIAELKGEDNREVAYQQALKLISYRQRSEAEVRRNLEGHKFSEEVIEETLERLRRGSLVNDARFANHWVENRSEFRPRSRRALRAELRQRGVDEDAISQAVEDLDEEELAYQAALKHSRKWKEMDWKVFRQKLTGFLARRGFNYEIIGSTVSRVWEERQNATNVDELHS